MKVSEAWLREWISPPLTGKELAQQLTMAGLEVDSYHPVAGEFTKVVVGLVVSAIPHPQADKLTLCTVSAGEGKEYNVVCGALNVRAQLKVALALPGAHLPEGVVIKETMLRGQLSQGMLCSSRELGLEDESEGIIELEKDAPVGMDLHEYLALHDYVLDIDLTPNRADCLSILGIAREVAALNALPFPAKTFKAIQPETDEVFEVHIDDPTACPQYYGRMIRSINPKAETPLWMKERLRRSGIRAIHPVVDVTQYVMIEMGQPLHAFNLAAITGAIQVRFAKPSETLSLLDGQKVVLNEKVLVIADEKNALAMAGIMGTLASAVSTETEDIFLESAYFNPITLAGVARRFGINSEASQRFERGVDPALQQKALERATELILSITGGVAGPVTLAQHASDLPRRNTIIFNPHHVKKLTGLSIPENEMANILSSLGMQLTQQSDEWRVEVPSYRFDLDIEADLIEEIIRLYGYDKLASQSMVCEVKLGHVSLAGQVSHAVAKFLKHRGYHETIHYSFVDPELQQTLYPDAISLKLLNPISQELSHMRVGMWPGLIAAMLYNVHRQQNSIQFFESGVIFSQDVKGTVIERPCIAGLLSGEYAKLNWSDLDRKFDFYDMKGHLEALFSYLHLANIRFVPAFHSALHPGQSAKILIQNEEAGWLGCLHPRFLQALDLQDDVLLFELYIPALVKGEDTRYQAISKYPQIRRDLSLLVDKSIMVEDIEHLIRDIVPPKWLKSFDVFDVYMGESIPAGKKSLGIALTLQDDQRTLIDNEVDSIISAILKKLNDDFAIVLRAGVF